MNRRVLVGVSFAVLVAMAFGVRSLRDGTPTRATLAPQVLVCATEMADACMDLVDAEAVPPRAVIVEEPNETAQRLANGGELGGAAWLAPRLWVDFTKERTRNAGRPDPLGTPSEALARSALVVIVRSDRRAVIESACDGRVNWQCLATTASTPWAALGGDAGWGSVRVDFDDPARTTSGRLVLAQIATTFARRSVIDERDLEPIRTTIEAVLEATGSQSATSVLDTMLHRSDASDMVVVIEANTRVAIASPKASGQLELLELEPEVGADVVLVAASGHAAPAERDDARRALTSHGWRFVDKTTVSTPSTATFDELLRLWRASIVHSPTTPRPR